MDQANEVRRWRDCHSQRERHFALINALSAAGGNVTHAARLLGVSRRHLSRILNEKSETSRLTETIRTGTDRNTGETLTRSAALTYGGAVPRLTNMSTPHVTTEPCPEKPPVEKLSVDLDPDMKRWLELEALKMKHEQGHSRPSMARVIVEALKEYRQRREQEQAQ